MPPPTDEVEIEVEVEAEAETPVAAPSAPAARAKPAATVSSYVATEEWTCRLLDRGFTIDEAAAIRGLVVPEIVRHATLAVRQGRCSIPRPF